MKKTIMLVSLLIFAMVLSACGNAAVPAGSSAPAETTAEQSAKTSAVIIEFGADIDASSIDADTFAVTDYVQSQLQEKEYDRVIEVDGDDIQGNEGAVEKIYVNDAPETDAAGGKDSGRYVIAEVNADYMLSGQNLAYTETMMAAVSQLKDVKAADGTVIPAGTEISNYEIVEKTDVSPMGTFTSQTPQVNDKSTIILPELGEGSGWTFNYIGDGAFKATDCYSEYTGQYCDFEMPYSIYVPDQATLDANKGKVALVIHMEHAGANDTDPMAAVTSSKAAVKLAGEAVQSKNPAIVVVPQIEESRRSTDDYDASSEANTAVWELLDWLINEEYADYIDTDRIYGTGQSMGGMTILNMASQRDNFFAGIAVIGAQWSNNYDKPYQHNGAPVRTPEVDPISFAVNGSEGFGHPVEWYQENFENWYYMVSDDNIFVHTCQGDAMSWGEWDYTSQYFAACGVEIPYVEYDPYLDLAEQNAFDKELTDHPNTEPGSGINWSTFTRGNHMSTWKYAYALDYPFEWLFNQTRSSEDARGKIEQLSNDWLGRDEAGNIISGSGTKGLNSAQFTPRGASEEFYEGWTVQ